MTYILRLYLDDGYSVDWIGVLDTNFCAMLAVTKKKGPSSRKRDKNGGEMYHWGHEMTTHHHPMSFVVHHHPPQLYCVGPYIYATEYRTKVLVKVFLFQVASLSLSVVGSSSLCLCLIE